MSSRLVTPLTDLLIRRQCLLSSQVSYEQLDWTVFIERVFSEHGYCLIVRLLALFSATAYHKPHLHAVPEPFRQRRPLHKAQDSGHLLERAFIIIMFTFYK